MRNCSCLQTAFLTLLLLGLTAMASAAEEYIIGPEDVIKISFWQAPELDQEATVRQDGKITVAIIGEITAAGLTCRELASQIENNISLYNKKISQATVTVTGFNSQKIFVSGQVITPGKKTFEVIPDLWTVVKEAGGATETGDLTRVTVIRSKESGGEVITVNVLEAISTGNLDGLPKLRSGDTVEVPKMAGGAPGRQLATEYAGGKNLIYVIGEVRTPGAQSFDPGTDLLDALGSAGGMTESADPGRIQIISKTGIGTSVTKVNLNKYQREGQARRVVIKQEDTIIVGAKKHSILSWTQLRDFAAVAGTVVSFIYLIQRR
jgi:polysaccharide export outer membrane protein